MKTGITANNVPRRTHQDQFSTIIYIINFSMLLQSFHFSVLHYNFCVRYLRACYISHYERDLHIVSVASPSLSNVKHVIL